MTSLFKAGLISLTVLGVASPVLAAEPVYWNTEEGMSRLVAADAKGDFANLANYYEAQNNKVFCGVASTTIVLNALRIPTVKEQIPYDTSLVAPHEMAYFPKKEGWSPYYHRYTQNTVLINSPKPRIEMFGKPHDKGGINDYGVQLQQFDALVKSNGAAIKTVELKDLAKQAEAAKADMIKALKTKDHYLVVNYSRPALEQIGAGHYSPVGAYDSHSDSFLVMDTNSVKYPWAWVKAEDLLKAMNTVDTDSYRGYSIISEG